MNRPATHAPIPLTSAQRSLLFLDRFYEGTGAANLACTLDIDGELSRPWLEEAIRGLFLRHHLLAARITEHDGCWCFEDGEPPVHPLALVDLTSRQDTAAALESVLERERIRAFPAEGPWLSATLVRLSPSRHVLTIVRHHVCSDGWSFAILSRDLRDAYGVLAAGGRPRTDAAPRFDGYAWACESWSKDSLQKAFWSGRLAGLARAVAWPAHASSVAPGDGIGTRRFRIGSVPRRLESHGRAIPVTPFCSLLLCLGASLWMRTGQAVFPIGTDLSCRDRREWEEVVGMFVNRATLRCDIVPSKSVGEHLRAMQIMMVDTLANKKLPFQDVVRAVGDDVRRGPSPLFNVMFGMHNNPHETFALAGTRRIDVRPPHASAPELDLSVYATNLPDGSYMVDVTFDDHVLSADWIEDLCRVFRQLAQSLPEHLDTTLECWAGDVDDEDPWAALQAEALESTDEHGGHTA